jgi:hypothetical protein
MHQRTVDVVNVVRMLVAALIAVAIPGSLLAYPFLVAGASGLLDLIPLTILAVVTYRYLNPPSAVSSGWLRASPGSAPASRDLILAWLDAPAARQGLLSAWPPMLGIFAGRVMANDWTPPRGPMLLYVAALAIFATTTTVSDALGGDADIVAPPRFALVGGRALLWSASIASFLWLVASMKGHFNSYY